MLSRAHRIALHPTFNVCEAFEQLCDLYSNALISFVSIPGAGSWLGATPELLVAVENKRIFRTTALAGTQPHTAGINLKTVAWTQKDIEEQALVERYIISCFKKIRLREYPVVSRRIPSLTILLMYCPAVLNGISRPETSWRV